MVKAILEDRKTQTRRVIKPQAHHYNGDMLGQPIIYPCKDEYDFGDPNKPIRCPYGIPGDRLWVRETWQTDSAYDPYSPAQLDSGSHVLWLADGASKLAGQHGYWGKIRTSIFMPRWASRITLEITNVRVQRVQEISNEDAKAEGIPLRIPDHWVSHRKAFAVLWDSINFKKCPWKSNPWVWVIEFKRV